MQRIGLNELRKRFLDFFESKGHLVLPSFSLVPENDQSILLINAGMTPLKPYFTGELKPPSPRVATCQKCIRTPDIEHVGHTARHGTFFEMLGNFSFGEYFKKEAITWAWEFFTKELEIPADKLWITIFEEDDEAFDIWNKDVGLPAERIVRMGKSTNFWEHGTGPCGPCSEIHFDRGEEQSCGKSTCGVGCDCDRYIEVWNLVFTQFYRHENGEYTKLDKKNIDTGMGLERLAVVMQGVENLFEVDTIFNILKAVCKITVTEYGASSEKDISIRLITDHIRSTVFMISDGIIPSNEGRGYVLRRLLRRAARHGRLLGIKNSFLYEIARVVLEESKEAYPELQEKWEYIRKTIETEENRFQDTIDQGLYLLEAEIKTIKAGGLDTIQGETAFKLHDTYGFPLDLTREIAEEHGLKVDENDFAVRMQGQREKAREAIRDRGNSAWGGGSVEGLESEGKTEFVGYESFKCESKALHLLIEGKEAPQALQGDRVTLIADRTPFYAESGGQVGDTGYISASEGVMRVEDCIRSSDGKHLHIGIVQKGVLKKGDRISLEIDLKRRKNIARNHTATHLLHKSLRNILGGHVAQAGSLVTDERMRFDFTHFTAMTDEEMALVEKEVNERIFNGERVTVREMSLKEAKTLGAEALFGEKYGERVRVITVDNYSMELCGGTHLSNTSEAGLFKILSEGGVASGVRRIEAQTGPYALEYLKNREQLLKNTAAILKTAAEECPKKAEILVNEAHDISKENEKLRLKIALSGLDEVISSAQVINGVKVISKKYGEMDIHTLRNTGDTIRNRLKSGVLILASTENEKVNLIVMATPDAVSRGVHAGEIIREASRVVGGGGGGRPDMAQAGGRDKSKISEALEIAVNIASKQTNS